MRGEWCGACMCMCACVGNVPSCNTAMKLGLCVLAVDDVDGGVLVAVVVSSNNTKYY